MRMDNLRPGGGAKTKGKRLGRGIGSGKGKTSGKGHKGQWARSGGGVRPGFEGGTMPLIRRLPKRGFINRFKKVFSIVNLSSLERFENGTEITAEQLLGAGVLSKIEPAGLKILGGGELTKKLTVKAVKFSESAKAAIEKAGGKAIVEDVKAADAAAPEAKSPVAAASAAEKAPKAKAADSAAPKAKAKVTETAAPKAKTAEKAVAKAEPKAKAADKAAPKAKKDTAEPKAKPAAKAAPKAKDGAKPEAKPKAVKKPAKTE